MKPSRLAWFSPLPPQPGGLASYSVALLRAIGKRVAIDLYSDAATPSLPEDLAHLRVRPVSAYVPCKDVPVVYNMGNNLEQCASIYETLRAHPGIVIVHDLNIHGFLLDYFVRSRRRHLILKRVLLSREQVEDHPYYQALTVAHGDAGASEARKVLEQGELPDIPRLPCHRLLTHSSLAAISHTAWGAEQLRRNGDPALIYTMPHGMDFPIDVDAGEVLRVVNSLKGASGEPLFVSGGFLEPNRRLETVVRAAAELKRMNVAARFAFVGQIDPAHRAYLDQLAGDLGIRDWIHFAGFVKSHEEFLAWLAASTAVVHLRFPTNGEFSGTVLRSLALGRPVLVTNADGYRELPDDCCWKVDVAPWEVALLTEYLAVLAARQDVRAAMGDAGTRLVRERYSWSAAADRLLEIVDSTIL